MVRDEFDEAFERLREQSNRLAATERDPENFDEIVEERVETDRLRDEVTEARKKVVSRFEPPAPDIVEPPRGYVHTKLIGKIGAGVAVVLLAVCGLVAFMIARDFWDGASLYIDGTVESVEVTDTGCDWRVEATLRNDTESPVTVNRLETVLAREVQWAYTLASPPIAAGSSGVVVGTWRLPASLGCPAAEDVDHGNLVVSFNNYSQVSRGF